MDRKQQYRRKFDFITDKLSHLPENLDEDEFYSDALFYRLQVSIDAVMDVVAMYCKDVGLTVSDDYSNIDHLQHLKIIPDELLVKLRRWNGLRNALVHRYNKVEEKTVVREKDDIVESILEFTKLVEELVHEKFTDTGKRGETT
ncbi:MAG: type VII toxin-antitoxin system HepT family RNase toxin [Promethearchaeota archaeon]